MQPENHILEVSLNMNSLVAGLPVLEMMHDDVHYVTENEPDPDDYIFLTLTPEEYVTVMLGLQMVMLGYECLHETVEGLASKIQDVVIAQKGENEDVL